MLQAITQSTQSFRHFGNALRRKFRSHAETDDGRHVFSTRTQAALVAAAGDQRLQFDTLVEHQRRRALRPISLLR